MPDCSGRDVLDKLVTGLNQVKDLSVAYLVRPDSCPVKHFALPAAIGKAKCDVQCDVQHSDLEQAQRDLTVAQYLVRVSRQSTLPAENKSIASESQPADALSVQGMFLYLSSWYHLTIIVVHAHTCTSARQLTLIWACVCACNGSAHGGCPLQFRHFGCIC